MDLSIKNLLLVAGPWLEERRRCMLAFEGYILFPAISVSCFACWLHEVSCLSVGIRRTQGPVLRLDNTALIRYPRMSLLKHGWPRMSRGPQNKHQPICYITFWQNVIFVWLWVNIALRSKSLPLRLQAWLDALFLGMCVACASVRMFLCPTVGSLCAWESDGSCPSGSLHLESIKYVLAKASYFCLHLPGLP